MYSVTIRSIRCARMIRFGYRLCRYIYIVNFDISQFAKVRRMREGRKDVVDRVGGLWEGREMLLNECTTKIIKHWVVVMRVFLQVDLL